MKMTRTIAVKAPITHKFFVFAPFILTLRRPIDPVARTVFTHSRFAHEAGQASPVHTLGTYKHATSAAVRFALFTETLLAQLARHKAFGASVLAAHHALRHSGFVQLARLANHVFASRTRLLARFALKGLTIRTLIPPFGAGFVEYENLAHRAFSAERRYAMSQCIDRRSTHTDERLVGSERDQTWPFECRTRTTLSAEREDLGERCILAADHCRVTRSSVRTRLSTKDTVLK